MIGDSSSEELDLRVKEIKFAKPEDGYYIFQAIVLEENGPRKKKKVKFKETSDVIVCKGKFINLYHGDTIHAVVSFVEVSSSGDVYQVKAYERLIPGTLFEIEKFLMSRKGVGEKAAGKIIEKYGLNALVAIAESEEAFEGTGVNHSARARLHKEFKTESVFDWLLGYLLQHHLDHRYALPLYERYGAQAMMIILISPYETFLHGVVDFQTADKLCYYAGIKYNHQERINMIVLAAVRFNSEFLGNLYVEVDQITKLSNLFLSYRKDFYTVKNGDSKLYDHEFERSVKLLLNNQSLVYENDVNPDSPALYYKKDFLDEVGVAEETKRLLTAFKSWHCESVDVEEKMKCYPDFFGSLSDDQREAIQLILTSPLSILTGGPGTGKTRTIQSLLKAMGLINPSTVAVLCAPTGKAANRLGEVTGQPSMTIHRLIGLGSAFKGKVKKQSLEADFLIIDEFSMADASLTHSLLKALSDGVRVVFVGDVNQLPSVGPGAVLNDFISSGAIPCKRLQTVFRQAQESNIIENAYRVLAHDIGPELLQLKLTDKKSAVNDFNFVQRDTPESVLDLCLHAVDTFFQRGEYGINDLQILTPIRKGTLGVYNLNGLLQKKFNPTGEPYTVRDREFRVGDKVIQVVNNYELEVFNGETGVISAIGEIGAFALIVEYSNDRSVLYEEKDLDQLELAYAITVHKSQGSEFPVVIMPIHETNQRSFNKNLIYTAITRAKNKVILIGQEAVIDERATVTMNERLTMLDKRILKAVNAE